MSKASEGSKKKNESYGRESWLNDSSSIQEKQNAVIYGDNSCPMREV
jgi:hypothetical protein